MHKTDRPNPYVLNIQAADIISQTVQTQTVQSNTVTIVDQEVMLGLASVAGDGVSIYDSTVEKIAYLKKLRSIDSITINVAEDGNIEIGGGGGISSSDTLTISESTANYYPILGSFGLSSQPLVMSSTIDITDPQSVVFSRDLFADCVIYLQQINIIRVGSYNNTFVRLDLRVVDDSIFNINITNENATITGLPFIAISLDDLSISFSSIGLEQKIVEPVEIIQDVKIQEELKEDKPKKKPVKKSTKLIKEDPKPVKMEEIKKTASLCKIMITGPIIRADPPHQKTQKDSIEFIKQRFSICAPKLI